MIERNENASTKRNDNWTDREGCAGGSVACLHAALTTVYTLDINPGYPP